MKKTSKKSTPKPGPIALKPLRELAVSRLDQFIAKYPEHTPLTERLKKSILSILRGTSVDSDTFDKLLPEIDRAADKLDDMYVYAAAQDVMDNLNNLARKSLSQSVSVFPEIAVELSLPSSRTGSDSAKAGDRTRLGGQPQWIQTDETPTCDGCQKAMTFVGQIDSIAAQKNALGKFLSDKKSFMFADVGMVYVFLCMKCCSSKSVVQSA